MDSVLITIGNIKIYWYSVMLLLGVIVGIMIATKESKRNSMNEYIDNLIFKVLISGIIGARLYYIIFNFESYKYNLLSIFKIWEGGLAIYGGIIGGLIAIVYNAKKYQKSIIDTTDIMVPGLIIAQSIGRWGNFFNKEAHGTEVTLAFLKKLHLPTFIIDGMHIDGTYYHPTFLYESIWCLLGFIVLLIIRKLTQRSKGVVTYSYFIWYGIGRFFIEGLRTDSLYLGNYRISQIVSILLIMVGTIGIIIKCIKNKKSVYKI